jgi:hypothetical protein
MTNLTMPDTKAFIGKVGQEVKIPVRAWAANSVPVNFMYENTVQKQA